MEIDSQGKKLGAISWSRQHKDIKKADPFLALPLRVSFLFPIPSKSPGFFQ